MALSPFGYITFLVSLLWLFSRRHRNRALNRKPPPSWFPEPHSARDIYVSLLSLDPPPPQPLLVSALLARAMTDVQRVISLREAKKPLQNLLLKGQVGDELLERLLVTEKELDMEMSEVFAEANEYSEGWGDSIFKIASEALQAKKCRDIYKKMPEERTRLTAELNVSRPFDPNPGDLRILGSKPAVPATSLKTSKAKSAMLENIRAIQEKLESEEEKKQAVQSTSDASTKSKISSHGSSHEAPQSNSDTEEIID